MTLERTFRLWGRPAMGDTDLGGRVVEVWYDRTQALPRALVRISAMGDVPDAPPDLPPAENNIHAAAYAASLAGILAASGAVFWVTLPVKGTPLGAQVALTGFYALDQFENGQQTLRLPLADRDAHSGLAFTRSGAKAKAEIALTLGLALPVALTKEPSGGGDRRATLVMTLGFAAKPAVKAALLRPVRAVYGDGGALTTSLLKLGDFGFGGGTLVGMHPYGVKYNGQTYTFGGWLGPDMAELLARLGLGRAHENKDNSTRIEFGSRQIKPGEWHYWIVCQRGVAMMPGDAVAELINPIANNALSLRMEQLGCELGLKDGKQVAEVEYGCALSDDQLREGFAAQRAIEMQGSTAIRLRCESAMRFGEKDPTGPDETDGVALTTKPEIGAFGLPFLAGGGLAEAARLQGLALRSLVTVASHPQSVAGRFGFRDTSASVPDNRKILARMVPLILFAHGVRAIHPLGGTVDLTPGNPPGTQAPLTLTIDATDATQTRHPFDALRKWPVLPRIGKPIRLSLPAFNTAQQEGRAGHRHRHIMAVLDPLATEAPGGRAAVAFYCLVGDPGLEAQAVSPDHLRTLRGRLGALAFDGPVMDVPASLLAETDFKSDVSRLRLSPRSRQPFDPNGGTLGQPPVGLDLTYIFNLSRIAPVTTDIGLGDRDDRADDLVVNDSRMPPDLQTRFLLEVRETFDDAHDRRMQAWLHDRAVAKGGLAAAALPEATEITASRETTTVIAQRPFALWRFVRQPLGESGGADNAVVAEYDSDTRVWSFKAGSEAYRLTLPPGVIGESTDKPGRLELHDGEGVDPALADVAGVPRSRLVEMRLSPPSDVWFTPSDLSRNYLRPELAARDLFMQRNDFGPGVALQGLRGELLYGLAFGLQVPVDDEGPQPRLVELQALVGRAFRPPASEDGTKLSRRAKAVIDTMADRPSRIEVITVDPKAAVPFRPAVLERGLNFALRHTALVRPPVAGLTPGDAPEPGKLPGPRFDEAAGLPGGAVWPVEQAAIARLLRDNPVADGGRIEGLALSPHGASGDQSVAFARGLVRIQSQTRGGFVQRQRVEVMGRIAVFWHRARHVVIYERSTAPSAQFTPEVGGDTRTRRPVLRKVEEFVEILEPVRSYPDDDAKTPARAPGFLRNVRFNSHIIHVDSAWGRDLGGFGWEVPLWSRGAAAKRPQVYPVPDVAFACVGDDAGGLVAQACLDVANLFFITDTEIGGDNTDVWPSRQGIDFSASGPPADIEDTAETALRPANGLPARNGRRAALPRVLPGLRRFTWRLAPNAQPVRLNAERGARPVLAGLESVTMMRSAPVGAGLSDSAKSALRRRLQSGEEEAHFNAKAPWSLTQALRADLGSIPVLIEAVTEADPDTLTNLRNALRPDMAPDFDFATSINRLVCARFGADGALPQFEVGTLIANIVAADSTTCARLAAGATKALDLKRQLIRHALASSEAELLRLVDILDADALRGRAGAKVNAVLAALIASAAPLDAVDDAVTTARAVVADWRADAGTMLARARERVMAFRNAYERGRPQSEHRMQSALKALDGELDRVQDEALAALTEAQMRLSTGIDGAASSLAALVGRAVRHALKATATAEGGFDAFGPQIRQALKRRVPVDRLIALAGSLSANLKTQLAAETDPDNQARLQAAITGLATLTQHVESIVVFAGAARAELESGKQTVATIAGSVLALGGTLDEAIGNGRQVLGAIIAGLDADLTAEVEAMRALLSEGVTDAFSKLSAVLGDFDQMIDAAASTAEDWLQEQINAIETAQQAALGQVDGWIKRVSEGKQAAETAVKARLNAFVTPLIDAAVSPLNGLNDPNQLRAAIDGLTERVDAAMETGLGALQGSLQGALTESCGLLVGFKDKLIQNAQTYADAFAEHLSPQVQAFLDAWPASGGDIAAAFRQAKALGHRLEQAVLDVESCVEHAKVYTDRLFDTASGVLQGGIGAAPGRALQLYAAATQAPELAALKVKAERIRLIYRDLGEFIGTSNVGAAFDRLGDALRGLGVDFRFDGLRDTLDFGDTLKTWDLRRMLPDFGGLKLEKFLPDLKVSDRIRDQVRISHDIDAKAGHAWVQIDVDIPVQGRTALFTAGPFTLNLRDTKLTARVRFDVDKDSDKVTTTDSARIDTNIEAVVAGQRMVTLEKAVIRYSRAEKLTFEIDPKNIRLHPNLRFVQDTFGAIFGGDVGGMIWIKENGIPVGVEHEFALPPLSLMYGTSGISNLSIANAFSLRAYPDFVITNRFSLSKRELPFLFSIFIIGGTGFVRIESEYRPFRDQLSVLVEVGLGGSAALGFSLGPVQGSVFISLSVVLTYRKLLGKPDAAGSGLTVALVLVIAGHVRLFGIVTIYLGLHLTLNYHDSGRIDAVGALSVQVRISRFIKLKYATRVTYKMRDGKTTKQVTSDLDLGGEAFNKAKKLEEMRRSL